MQSAVTNPLLDFTGLPRFSAVRADHISPAVDAVLTENRALIERLALAATPATWDDFVRPLEDANERLARAWSVVAHLHGVLDSPPLREAYSANQPKLVQYYTELGQNFALFEKYKAIKASPEYSSLTQAQRKIIDNEIRDFRLAGAELPAQGKKRFTEIQEELARLCTRFSENVLDATNAFAMYVEDQAELAGIPQDVLESARAGAEKEGKPGWKLILQAPCYQPVMQYAENRSLREKMYRAHVTRASEFGAAELDNTALIQRILALRRESARLLGYENYAELSLVHKMADSPQQVLAFLQDLAGKALLFARRDYAELQEFARAELGLAELSAWDIAWASERLRARRYAFSDQELKQYFQEPKVLEGMFRVAERLYGLQIEPDSAEVWDPAVRFFRIVDRRGAPHERGQGQILGRFYLDPYARDTKRGGAWMDEAISRRKTPSGVQLPVAYLVCNFSSPVGTKHALLRHEEVLTLFHEFGHGLHHLLTRVDFLGVSGIRGVEWDAIELPSQFMENFCWEWEVLRHMTAHVETGEPLPRALYEKMLAAKNFHSGMQMARQLEYALFDMHLHFGFDPESSDPASAAVIELLEDVRRKVAVVFPPAYERLPNSFGHLFAGPAYAAGYYSYKWAEVLSADAYSAFEEMREENPGPNGVLDPGIGSRFLEEILAVGGSRPAIESFKAFRGREPRVDALLKHNGMIVT